MSRRLLAGVVIALLLAAGCSSGDDTPSAQPTTTGAGTSASSPPTTKAVAKDDLTPYAARGPYAAGQVTLALADGRRVVVWYPADKQSVKGKPSADFDIASLLRPELQTKIPAAERPPFPIDAYPGAKPATSDGPYPVVLFSHGFGGFPEQSATITTHMASWGFVVAAPDHVERSLSGLLGTGADGVPKLADTEVLKQTLSLVEAQSGDTSSPLSGLVDSKKVAVTGHSAGAGAAYQLAAIDPDISSFISYSVGVKAGTPTPKVPGMIMLGTTDGVIPPEASRKAFEGMEKPKYLVEIAKGGHLVFSDICTIGRAGGGIVAIGKRLGLPIEQFEKLGTDGCKPGDTTPENAADAINDLSVAFLRFTLGIDPKPVGLDDPAIAKQFVKADITVTADP